MEEPTYIGISEFFEIASEDNDMVMRIMLSFGDYFAEAEYGWQIVTDPEDIKQLNDILGRKEVVH